jgi:hypothetical protein
LTLDDAFGAHVATIHQLLFRQECFGCQIGLNLGKCKMVLLRCRYCLHLRNEVQHGIRRTIFYEYKRRFDEQAPKGLKDLPLIAKSAEAPWPDDEYPSTA